MNAILQRALWSLAITTTLAGTSQAQTYPSGPVRLLVGFPAGGSVDIAARIIAPKLSERLGQPVIVENRPGAAGNIAADVAKKSPPDGLTVYVATSVNVVSPSLYKNLSYDPIKDFLPVARLISTSYLLVVNPSLPVKSLQDFVAFARARPQPLNYGTTGNGSPAHLAAELFKLSAGIDLVHIPYKGGPPVVADLLSGQIQLTFSNIPSVLPLVKSGKLRSVAITSLERSALVPDVPTVAESGFKDFEVISWYGFLVPANTPPDAVNRLAKETLAVLEMKDVREQLALQGLDPAPMSPGQLGAFMKSELTKYQRLITEAKITAD